MEKRRARTKSGDDPPIACDVFDLLAPTVFVSLLVLIGSGLYYLMANYTRQVELTPGYYNLFGIKMVFVIAALFLSIYQTFPLRGRISNLDLVPENRKLVPATLRTQRAVSRVLLAVLSMAVFLGIWLARFS